MEKGTIVTITVDHPCGVDNTNVKGNVGIIKCKDRYGNFQVKDTSNNTFFYSGDEIRFATQNEIIDAFIKLMER